MKPRPLQLSFRIMMALVLLVAVGASLIASQRAAARTAEERLDAGRRIYLASCAMCHGEQGNGDGPLAPELLKEAGTPPAQLTDATRIAALGRAGVRKVIVEGGGHQGRSSLMPAWGEKLAPSMADDVTDFVMALPALDPAIPPATLAKYLRAPKGSPVQGKQIFVYYCSGCHGLSGRGDGIYAPTLLQRHKILPRNLTEKAYFAKKTDPELFAVVSLGGGHIGGSAMMPAWTATLTPEQVKHSVAYVRALSKTKPQP